MPYLKNDQTIFNYDKYVYYDNIIVKLFLIILSNWFNTKKS